LRCATCGESYRLDVYAGSGNLIREAALRCRCWRPVPVIAGVPRILPEGIEHTLVAAHAEFYRRHPGFLPRSPAAGLAPPVRTLHAFGDEWRRFPGLLGVHERIFDWYFEGPEPVRWKGLRVLDAGCGMGRWLHFARRSGADIIGMDLSPAVDVAAAREGDGVEFVQADLRRPPFPPESFDLVYCLGVLHHLEEPLEGVRALSRLVRPGGELRIYVYRTFEGEPRWKRALLATVTGLRRITTQLPYSAVHVTAWLVAVLATLLLIWPCRLLSRWAWGERLVQGLPLAHYTDVPFRMVVSEQFDRLVAPIERRFSRQAVEGWLRDVGFEIVAILPGLGWRAIGRRPTAGEATHAAG